MTPDHPLIAEALRLHREGDFARAAELYQSILRSEPRNFEALYLLGFLYGQNRQFDLAQFFVGEAIKLNPVSVEGYFARGFALQQLHRYQEAYDCLSRALALKPDFAEALLNRASSLFRLRRYREAAEDYERLLAQNRDYPFALGNLMFSRLHICDWRGFDGMRAEIAACIAAGKRVVAPFDSKVLGLSPALELRCAQLWVADQCPPASPLWRGETYDHDKIRLAYVSADFHSHAAASLTAGLFEGHDRERFEVDALSLGPDDGSVMRARLVRGFDRFVDGRAKSDTELAGLLRDMEIDIAIDMMGFTEGCRPGIFAMRPAPLQVSYLGFPGTMGADYIDYLIADDIVVPKARQSGYSENVVTLPDCFMPSDSTRSIGTRIFTRAEEGLPETGFVFCCFNAGYKVNPPIFDVWMRLLSKVEGSVLWLAQPSDDAQRNLKREAVARGVGAERLVFARYQESAGDHLARLRLADLFLDTLPYNAHATANDALWSGVPVLTCAGEGFAGRVAASLLHAVGLPQLVTGSLEAYERLALELAMGPDALADLRARLARNRSVAPLFDTSRYVRNLESAYATMWERHRRGLPPQEIAVGEVKSAGL